MGILPLQYKDGDTAGSLGLDARETFSVTGVSDDLAPHTDLEVKATTDEGSVTSFTVECRIDSDVEVDYFRNGGVLQMVLRRMLKA
jgi:aconitate hydratase